MKHSPYKIVRMFEEEIAEYTGSPYAVSIDSCTNALFLVCKYLEVKEVTIPSQSFHIKKLLPIWKGGMILTDDEDAYNWFKKARYEGRSEKYYKDDDITFHGWNMYMTPQQAAHGLSMFQNYPEHMSDLGEDNGYRDLTEFTVFKDFKTIE